MPSGYRQRQYRFGNVALTVRLPRAPVRPRADAAFPMYAHLWQSAPVLCESLAGIDVCGRRVLEVGAGLGLASLVLARRGALVTAIDIEPQAATLFARNAQDNDITDVRFVTASWSDPALDLGAFDLVVGSDLLYERPHNLTLAAFVQRHVTATGDVVLVDPGRGQHLVFDGAMRASGWRASVARRPFDDDPPGAALVFHYRHTGISRRPD